MDNNAKYHSRLDYIRRLLSDCVGLSNKDVERTEIAPIQYEPNFPFKYNNFVYRISLPTGLLGIGDADQNCKLELPGCVPIPADTRDFIIRLSNPDAEGIHQENRVQNEVGMLVLASTALQHIKPSLVPRVFGWGGASDEHSGWILQELMPGTPLAKAFSETMSLEGKKVILWQMAEILKALQDYSIPKSIEGWGGVTFDRTGAIISAPMTSVGAGPWSSLEDSFRGRLKRALAKADAYPQLRGWRDNGIRERINAFIEDGLPAQFFCLTSSQDRAIVHADFTPDNLLYSPETGRLTALLDFDFASVLHPAYEFFRSFASNGGQLNGWSDETISREREAVALRNAKLTGQFPSPLPVQVPSENGVEVDWELAQAWETELRKLDVKRPSTIQGIDKLADVDKVLCSLLPWRLTNEDFLRINPDEHQRLVCRRMYEKQLDSLLSHVGF